MYDAIYERLEKLATWPGVGALFVLCILLSIAFTLRQKRLGPNNQAPDGRGWYTPEQARDFFQAIGASGRRLYAISELTLDVLFPLAYSSLMAAFIINLYGAEAARTWILVPLLAAATDLAENVTLAALAYRFDGQPSPLARLAAVLTLLKVLLLLFSLFLIAVGAWKSWPR